MIHAVFHKSKEGLTRAEVSGHAGYAERGEDIVCASVTSAVQLTANGITEVLCAAATVVVEEDTITIGLESPSREAICFLEALRLHLEILCEQYKNTIRLTVLEV